MQTFLPYADFEQIAKCLDFQRLGAQRREAQQTLDTILGKPTKDGKPRKGYVNHPTTRFWKGYENALRLYINEMILEFIQRGGNNNMLLHDVPSNIKMPWWLGDEELHSSHRSNLYYKNPRHYSKFNWKEANQPVKPYVWIRRKDEQ